MTAPVRVSTYAVRLRHRNGGTTDHKDLTLDEARSLASRSVNGGKAPAAEVLDSDGKIVGRVEVWL